MRTAVLTALAFGCLFATSVASPIEASVPEAEPEPQGKTEGYDDDDGYQGGALESVLGQISNHAGLVGGILGSVGKLADPGEISGMVGQIAPQLGAVISLLDNIPIFGKGRPYSYAPAGRDLEPVEAEGYPTGKPKCGKLCVFDLVGQIVLQVHGLVFQTVSTCGLGFVFQYLNPLVLVLIKTLTSFDLVVGGIIESVQGPLNQMLGKLGSGLIGGLPGIGSGY
ncbi:uncharacterized protein PG986_000129 [Apiospora aurea]|uniref:Uncharacterized protein n=1 Tax=Apiospora aurea TaxID=335848 RepID=A0ABR1QTK0_9PEZI